jgi:hypothetical protein
VYTLFGPFLPSAFHSLPLPPPGPLLPGRTCSAPGDIFESFSAMAALVTPGYIANYSDIYQKHHIVQIDYIYDNMNIHQLATFSGESLFKKTNDGIINIPYRILRKYLGKSI